MKDEKDTKTVDFLTCDSATATKKRGRPQKYVDSASRQKAYRERIKDAGMREIKVRVRDVRDDQKPLRSDIIDLSAVRSGIFQRVR